MYTNNVLDTAGNSKFYYSNLSYTTGWVIEVLEKYVTVMNDTTLVLSHAFVADLCDDRYERVRISTSVNTQKTSAISVYPNPTSNVVNISSSISDGRIDVINSSGLVKKSVQSFTLPTSGGTLALTSNIPTATTFGSNSGSATNFGATNYDIDASIEIWKFFSRYDINGVISQPNMINEQAVNKELIKVIDLFGRESKEKNQPLFYIYDDGTVKKKMILE